MGNFDDAYKVQSFLNEFNDKLTDLINKMTNWELFPDKPRFEVGNPFPLLVVDEYLTSNNQDRLFVEQLFKCEKDFKEFESIIPSMTLLNIDFSQTLNKFQYISDYYINKYETEYKGMLKYFIEIEKEKSIKSGILINTSPFLNTNQYKRLYDICSSVKATIKSNYIVLKNQITGFTCSLDLEIIKKAYPKLTNEYITCKQINFEAVFKPEPLPDNFEPIIWKKVSTRNKVLNKKSLIDLLRIAGIKDIDIIKVNRLFATPSGEAMDITSSNIFNNKGNEKSEFYAELKSFFPTF